MPPKSAAVTPSIYDSIYRKKLQNNLLNQIDTEATGGEIAKLKTTAVLSEDEPERYKNLLTNFLPAFVNQDSEKYFLDLGCGFGVLGRWLASQLEWDFMGIDFSEVAIRQAQTLAKLDDDNNRFFLVADFSALPLKNQSVAVAFSLDSIYLTENPRRVLREIHRALQFEGVLLFTFYENRSKQFSHRYIERHTWSQLLKDTGFQIAQCNNITEKWQNQMSKKHNLRWKERKKILLELGQSAEPELEVSAAMLGFNGKASFIKSTSRYEMLALSNADSERSNPPKLT